MKTKSNKYITLLMLVVVVFASCKKQWDQHDQITDPSLTVNLLQQINSNADLSTFSQYLAKSGYDKVLASSKQFTVWAPNNAAMKNVDPAILTDSARLSQFVGNHISYQLYTTNIPQPTLRVKMLNGKNETFTKTTIEQATIVKSDQYASNGIFHIINKAISVKLNIWDYVTNTGAANGQGITADALNEQAYLLTQNYSYQDTSLATVVSIDPLTGKPVLKAGTGIVNKNHYKDNVADLSNEDKQYTFFVFTDAGLNTQISAESKYFATSSSDSTYKFTAFNVLKDLAVAGVYSTKGEPGTIAMPDTIISQFGVKVPIRMADTLRSYNASNGRVYIMNNVNFRLVDKITPIKIEGESDPAVGNPGSWFARTDRGPNTYYRIKNDPNGVQFKDIYIEGNSAQSLTALFYAGYPIQNMYSASYKVYIRAINDTKTVYSQQLNFGAPYAASLPYTQVALNNYSEVYLGTYTVGKYGYNSMFLVGANSTTSGQNSLTMDYVKLVPILQ